MIWVRFHVRQYIDDGGEPQNMNHTTGELEPGQLPWPELRLLAMCAAGGVAPDAERYWLDAVKAEDAGEAEASAQDTETA